MVCEKRIFDIMKKADSKEQAESFTSSKVNFVFASSLHSLTKVHKMRIINKSFRDIKLVIDEFSVVLSGQNYTKFSFFWLPKKTLH